MGQGLNIITATAASKRMAIFLFLGLAIFLIPETIAPSILPFYKTIKLALLTLLTVNLISCTIFHLNKLRKTTIVIHLGCLAVIAGGIAGQWGYVATINIYEGGSSKTAFRWDRQADLPLGFELQVLKINTEYYPIPVKVGVLENDVKKELFLLKTGESFRWKEYTIRADNLDIERESLHLSVYKGDKAIGAYTTSNADEKKNSPFDLKLVAFQDPVIKRTWLDIALITENGRVNGISEVNNPFIWEGIRFFHTSHDVDPSGASYAGLQIVKDPGVPMVYLGFILIITGGFLHLVQHHKIRERAI